MKLYIFLPITIAILVAAFAVGIFITFGSMLALIIFLLGLILIPLLTALATLSYYLIYVIRTNLGGVEVKERIKRASIKTGITVIVLIIPALFVLLYILDMPSPW